MTANMTVADFDASRRAAASSAGYPLVRMAAPSVLRRDSVDPDGSFVVPFWIGKKGLLAAFPGKEPRVATPESVESALNSPQFVAAPLDRAAVRAMVKLCSMSGEAHRDTARLIDFVTKMPMSSKLFVMTEGLRRKFWLSTDLTVSSIKDWRAAFGLPYDLSSISVLAGKLFADEAMIGKQVAYRGDLFKSEDKATDMVIQRGAAAAMSAFEASNTVSEAWGAYERVDTTLRNRFLVEGVVARARPLRQVGPHVVVSLSTPFKVREGTVMVTDETDDANLVRTIELSDLGFDGTLLGSLHPGTTKTGRQRVSDAMPSILGAMASHGSVLITGAPFMAGGGFTPSVKRWASRDGVADVNANPVIRDVPLDVVLAGGPVS